MIDEVQGARALDRFARNAVELRRRTGLSQARRGPARRAPPHRGQHAGAATADAGLETLLRVAGAVEAEPWELLEGLAWDLDRGRLWETRPDPGRYEVVVAGQRVTYEADGWKKVDP